jgi:hypothetical protein
VPAKIDLFSDEIYPDFCVKTNRMDSKTKCFAEEQTCFVWKTGTLCRNSRVLSQRKSVLLQSIRIRLQVKVFCTKQQPFVPDQKIFARRQQGFGANTK